MFVLQVLTFYVVHVKRKNFRPPEPGMLVSHVLIEGLPLHFINTQNRRHEVLSMSPQEIEQVTMATVLCNHQHGA